MALSPDVARAVLYPLLQAPCWHQMDMSHCGVLFQRALLYSGSFIHPVSTLRGGLVVHGISSPRRQPKPLWPLNFLHKPQGLAELSGTRGFFDAPPCHVFECQAPVAYTPRKFEPCWRRGSARDSALWGELMRGAIVWMDAILHGPRNPGMMTPPKYQQTMVSHGFKSGAGFRSTVGSSSDLCN